MVAGVPVHPTESGLRPTHPPLARAPCRRVRACVHGARSSRRVTCAADRWFSRR